MKLQDKRKLWKFENSSTLPSHFDVAETCERWTNVSLNTLAARLTMSRLGTRWPSSTDMEDAQRDLHLYLLWSCAPHEEQKRARAWERTRGYSTRDAERFADETGMRAGRWVAVKDREVLYSGDSPRDVVSYLREHGLRSDSLFRVPIDPEHDQTDNI